MLEDKITKIGINLKAPELGIEYKTIFVMETYRGVAQINFFHRKKMVLECFVSQNGEYKIETSGILNHNNKKQIVEILSAKARKILLNL